MIEIEVDVGIGRPCHRCDGALILLAQVPHGLTSSDGSRIEGTRSVGICAVCDRHDRDAQGILAFFAVHETVTGDTLDSLVSLIDELVGRVARRWASGEREIGDEVDRYLNSSGSRKHPGDDGAGRT